MLKKQKWRKYKFRKNIISLFLWSEMKTVRNHAMIHPKQKNDRSVGSGRFLTNVEEDIKQKI